MDWLRSVFYWLLELLAHGVRGLACGMAMLALGTFALNYVPTELTLMQGVVFDLSPILRIMWLGVALMSLRLCVEVWVRDYRRRW